MTGTANEVLDRRKRYWANGYRPLEVWNPDQQVNDKGEPLNSPGKQPRGRWRELAGRNPPEAAERSPDGRALNTGLLCGAIVAFDVDVLVQELADQVVHMIEFSLGATPLVRVGRAPKILLVYRPECPFGKQQTPELFLADGTKLKVELLAEGQQFVADGIHPETRQRFTWTNGSPETVPTGELPIVTEEQARQVVAEAERILRKAGAEPKKEKAPRARRKGMGQPGEEGDFFKQINAAALTHIARWARALFPHARFEPGTGAWRISSKDLGRDLEEDISIHPDGIRDFGLEAPRTAIDLVKEYGSAVDAVAAGLWLCGRLGLDPDSLGYRTRRRQTPDLGDSVPPPDFDIPPGNDADYGTGLPADDRPPEYSDEALALRFSRQHAADLRYLATFSQWLLWSGHLWAVEDTLRAFDLARAVCRSASAQISDPRRIKLAAAVASAKTVAAVERLARADRRHATQSATWDSADWSFNVPSKADET